MWNETVPSAVDAVPSMKPCGHDPGCCGELSGQPYTVHLMCTKPDAEWRKTAQEYDIWLELLNLREFGGEIWLIRSNGKRRDDLSVGLRQRFAEEFVLPFAKVGRIMDDDELLVSLLSKELGCKIRFADHRPADAMNLMIVVAIGDCR